MSGLKRCYVSRVENGNLKHIQRSEPVEAAIRRDFAEVLHAAEKKSWHKANDYRGALPP